MAPPEKSGGSTTSRPQHSDAEEAKGNDLKKQLYEDNRLKRGYKKIPLKKQENTNKKFKEINKSLKEIKKTKEMKTNR